MYSSIHFYNNHEGNTCRCINHLIVYFSLSNHLTVLLNGERINVNDGILIINHNDLYKVLHGDKIIAVTIPLFYLSQNHKSLFVRHYDYKSLRSIFIFKWLTYHIIDDYIYKNKINTSHFSNLLHLLNKEARVNHGKIYKPIINSDCKALNEVTSYINDYSLELITSNYLAQQLFYSSSYVSSLFKRHLDICFKYYISSLKIALSIPELLLTNSSLVSIASNFGFKSYNTYLTHFKNYLKTTPNAFRQQYNHVETYFKINFHITSNELTKYLHLMLH